MLTFEYDNPHRADSVHDGRVMLDGAILKQLRQQIGLSQEALAQRCVDMRLCVSIASIKRAEAGRPVIYRTARHLASSFGLALDDLLPKPIACSVTDFQANHETSEHPDVINSIDVVDEIRNVIGIWIVMIQPYQVEERIEAILRRTLRQFGGNIQSKFDSDIKFAVFGVPQSYLSDAIRCVQCALELVRELSGNCIGMVVAPLDWTASGGDARRLAESDIASVKAAASGTCSVWVASDVAAQLFNSFVFESINFLPNLLRLVGSCHLDRLGTLPLIGRYREIQQYKAVVQATASSSCGQVIYLRGVAGVGKSRLIAEFADIALQTQFGVHHCAVFDFGAECGGAMAQLVRSLLGILADGTLTQRAQLLKRLEALPLSGEHTMMLGPLIGLEPLSDQATIFASLTHETRQQRMITALRELVSLSSRTRPLLLLVEDVHWGSPAFFDILGPLLSVSSEAPVIFLLSARYQSDPLDEFLRPHCIDLPLTVFDLVPLRKLESEALALQFSHVHLDYRQQCVDRARGNPLFLTLLLRSAPERKLPDCIKRLVLSQLDRMPALDRRALRAASVIGERFSSMILGDVLRLDGFDVRRLVQMHLVRPDGPGAWVFVHDLVLHAVYDSIVPEQRALLHIELSRIYRGRDIALCAQHLHRAQDPQAPAMFVKAIQLQVASYNFAAAFDLVQQCRRIRYAPIDDYELSMLGAEAAAKMGLSTVARAGFEQALGFAGTTQQRVFTVLALARTLNLLEDLDAEENLLAEILPEAVSLNSGIVFADLHYLLGNIHFPRGDFASGRRHHEIALGHAIQANASRLQALALSGLGDSYYAEGRMAKAHEVFRNCLTLCEQHAFPDIEASNRFMLGTVRIYLGHTSTALDDALASAALGQRVGNRRAEVVSRLTAGWALLALGQTERAREEVVAGLDTARELKAVRFEAFLTESLARLAWIEGDPGSARKLIREAWMTVERHKLHRFIGPWVLGTQALLSDDIPTIRQVLQLGQRLINEGSVGHNAYRFHVSAAETWLLHGNPDDALSHAQALRALHPTESCIWVEHHASLIEDYADWMCKPSTRGSVRLSRRNLCGESYGYAHTMPALRRRIVEILHQNRN